MDEKPKQKKSSLPLDQLEHIAEHLIASVNSAKMQTLHKLNFHKLEEHSEDEIHFTFTKDGQFYTIDKDGNLLDDKPFEF